MQDNIQTPVQVAPSLEGETLLRQYKTMYQYSKYCYSTYMAQWFTSTDPSQTVPHSLSEPIDITLPSPLVKHRFWHMAGVQQTLNYK